MIKCHLSELMGKKRLKIADLARKSGLHSNTITLLFKEEARVELEAIGHLCQYFSCKVVDLFEYMPDESSIETFD